MPALAGKSQAELLRALLQFRAASAATSVMPQLVRGYSESELVALAHYFAQQK